ncbi:MAG: acetyl-CoA carboxylase, carboxyltransferase subunit beta [Planctomycetota bacterium]|nr:acetyl-CoA carboxylase, carboxyltransferase subunit beta [Planctomycetota bacterium]
MAWGSRRLGAVQPKNVQPEGQFTKCPGCAEMLFVKDLEKQLNVCRHCGHHLYMGAWKRIRAFLDEDGVEELFGELETCDPLEFRAARSYKERLEECQARTGMKEAAVIVRGRLKGIPLIVGVTDADFLMGSMGSVVGEKITRAFETAAGDKLPVVIFSGSGGGARMDEGILSLMQMAKTSAAVAHFGRTGLPYISYITNPTLGGVSASFAFLGDIIVAEPGALVGFTGPRVIKQTMRTELPKGFQTAEFMCEHGQIDMIVHRKDMRDTIARILSLLTGKEPVGAERATIA